MLGVAAGAALSPAVVSLAFYRTPAGEDLAGDFVQGARVLLSNCVAYADATGSVTQDLSGLTITVAIGDHVDSVASTTGNVQTAADGTFWASITIPTNANIVQWLQVGLSNAVDGAEFLYPERRIVTRTKIGS